MAVGASPSYSQEPLATALSSAKVANVNEPKQINQIIHNFQQRLVELGSDKQVTACDNLIYYYGQVSHTSRRAVSFGGVCVLSNKGRPLHVMMCNDYMIGKFTLGGTDRHTREGVSRFIKNNCPPGG
jgi:hypothetical protein